MFWNGKMKEYFAVLSSKLSFFLTGSLKLWKITGQQRKKFLHEKSDSVIGFSAQEVLSAEWD